MQEEQTHIEWIESYHEGRLSESERTDFEVRLLFDLELQQENDHYLKVRKSLADIKLQRVKNRLNEMDAEMDAEKKYSSQFRVKSILSLVAVLAVVVGSAWYFVAKDSGNTLNAEQLIPDEFGVPVLMSNNPSARAFDDAMSAFKLSDYKLASQLFQELIAANPDNDTLQYYLANSLLRSGRIESAKVLFIPLGTSNSKYAPQSRFYLAISSYLLSQDRSALLATMRPISLNDTLPMHEKASEIVQLLTGSQ